jgi:hypothetical protein
LPKSTTGPSVPDFSKEFLTISTTEPVGPALRQGIGLIPLLRSPTDRPVPHFGEASRGGTLPPMSRRPILVAAAILLFASGFAAGRLTWTPPASAVVVAAEKPAATRSPGRTPRVEAVPGDELGTAKAEAAAWKALYDGLALEVYGEPVAFPEDTPEKYTEARFRAAIDEILRTCDIPADLVNVDCAEYPCMAAFRERDGAYTALTGCEAWSSRYGGASSMASMSAECGDGREESLLVLSPVWEEGHERLNAEDKNLHKRLGARWEEIQVQWACAPPPPR